MDPNVITILSNIKAATDAGAPNGYVDENISSALTDQGLIEVNPNMRETREDGQFTGAIAARLTAAGVQALSEQPTGSFAGTAGNSASEPVFPALNVAEPAAPFAPVAEAAVAPLAPPAPAAGGPVENNVEGYTVLKNLEIPDDMASKSRRPSKKFPIDSLEDGDALFVPKDAAKSASSIVSRENKRYADFNPARYFTRIPVEKGLVVGGYTAQEDGVFIQRRDDLRPTAG